MDQTAQAAQTIAKFLQTFTTNGGLRLRFRVKVRTPRPSDEAPGESETSSDSKDLVIEFTGPDVPVLTARNGEVLNALEHIATKILRLEPDQHHHVTFDADHFKANRDRQLQDWAVAAVERVRTSGRPHSFPPMSSRERRHLHMLLSESGLPTASSGEGPGRFVVLYPADGEFEPAAPQRRPDPNNLRRAFRHR